jgi:hypothetical protein
MFNSALVEWKALRETFVQGCKDSRMLHSLREAEIEPLLVVLLEKNASYVSAKTNL